MFAARPFTSSTTDRSTRFGKRSSCKLLRAQIFMGQAPESVGKIVDSIKEAVAHSSCAPYYDLATESTMIINPPWSAEGPRATGLSHATCGVTTQTEYTEEHVRPIAAGYETDGSMFLLWERRANYSGAADGIPHKEDICGVTYVKQDTEGKAAVIGTFRQPSAEELKAHFKPGHDVIIRPGSDNFFDGREMLAASPVCEMQMAASVREFYAGFELDKVEPTLARVADPRLRIREPMWEVNGSYLPVNRVEAQLWMERMIKNSGGKLKFTPKTIVPCEGTNLVFCLWFAEGLDETSISGVHLFFFGDDLKIKSIAIFREPTGQERRSYIAKVAAAQ